MQTHESNSTRYAERSIQARMVTGSRRLAFLPKHYGKAMLLVESTVYDNAREICEAYAKAGGGFWEYVDLSNGGAFMFPRGDAPTMAVSIDGNGYKGELSREAFGILTTLYALSVVSMYVYQRGHEGDADRLSTQYHRLRDYMLEHPERVALLAAAD
jgi:hypothetical protein